MQRTMLKSKIHRATENYIPRVVHVGAESQILRVDREVATLLGASDDRAVGALA